MSGLTDTAESRVGARLRAPVGRDQHTREAGGSIRVLIVEDNPVNRTVVVRRLDDVGYWSMSPPTASRRSTPSRKPSTTWADGLSDAGDGRVHRHRRNSVGAKAHRGTRPSSR